MDLVLDRLKMVVPKKGEINGRWISYVKVTWPIVVTLIGMTWWVSDKFDTREDTTERTKAVLAPIEVQMKRNSQDIHEMRSDMKEVQIDMKTLISRGAGNGRGP